jgi:phage terminase small subunit
MGKEVALMKLTPKQKAFCDYYIETGNATQSALKAGYSKNYAKGNSVKLLENVSVKSYIDERMQKIESERIATAAEVMQYLTKIMRGEDVEEVVVVEGEGDGCSSARRVEKSLNQKDRIKAAELIGKRYMMWTEKVEVKNEAEEEKAKKIDNIESLLEQMKPVGDDQC